MADKLEMKVRKEYFEFLKRKAQQYRKQAMKNVYDNPKRYNELVYDARQFDICAGLIYSEEDD